MAGLLSGLTGLGLDHLENVDIFAQEEKKADKTAESSKEIPRVEEKDLIYDRAFECPVCDMNFQAKIMKSGKAKLLGTDMDLRPRYEGIDSVKYDVILCPRCGYAALNRYFGSMSAGQVKLIKENISRSIHLHTFHDEIYTYEEALERYKVCLANAVVKHAKASEKAYICLRSAWLLRGYAESLEAEKKPDTEKIKALKAEEEAYLQNALGGFAEARQNESYPMCGMDENTVDYLLAVLATRFEKYEVASKLVGSILTSASANARMKERTRELKEQILEGMRKQR
ncbi:MAG: DUF2225 domain-containing protein [Lachnospiraceae bacterium]|nr:DUF2225 domain-containing protein [Lachnospiraceae bacterium]